MAMMHDVRANKADLDELKKQNKKASYPLFIDYNYLSPAGLVTVGKDAIKFIEQHDPEVVLAPGWIDGKIASFHLLPFFRFEAFITNYKSMGEQNESIPGKNPINRVQDKSK